MSFLLQLPPLDVILVFTKSMILAEKAIYFTPLPDKNIKAIPALPVILLGKRAFCVQPPVLSPRQFASNLHVVVVSSRSSLEKATTSDLRFTAYYDWPRFETRGLLVKEPRYSEEGKSAAQFTPKFQDQHDRALPSPGKFGAATKRTGIAGVVVQKEMAGPDRNPQISDYYSFSVAAAVVCNDVIC
ncbi:hypothetical protein OIU85_020841 [Salix viminalis]|uniref:Uncharacterized protein n=1 Tax=Salix viminalis TaxID=40686 RepID=A0A9Q0ZD54_SALVM|nr:hypothetical protein OIU85_020841 [Salix viminalis]